MKRIAFVALALAASLAAQVAREANSGYRTEAQRKQMAAGLGDPERARTQAPELLVHEMGLQPGMTVPTSAPAWGSCCRISAKPSPPAAM